MSTPRGASRAQAETADTERAPDQAPSPFVAVVGLNVPDGAGGELRVEAGDPVPADAVEASPWLHDEGLVSKEGAE